MRAQGDGNTGPDPHRYNYPMTSTEKRIIDLLQAKRKEDPDGFRDYLPAVSELLPSLKHEDGKTPLDLRDEEMESHRVGLRQALSKLESGAITPAEAIKGLEQCVFVMKYDFWKEDLWHDSVLGLVKAALGKPPESFLSVTTVRVSEDCRACEGTLSLSHGALSFTWTRTPIRWQ